MDALVDYINLIMHGEGEPAAVVFMDEMEKMFAGNQGDTSGTTQDITGQFLTWTESTTVDGELAVIMLLLLGHPGVGKSLIAKATGNQFKKPTIMMNVGGMKSKYVGAICSH